MDLKSGTLSGYAYSANVGWISLSNASARVQTDFIAPGAPGLNGLPKAWMLDYFATIKVNAEADPDGDGMSNRDEYLAGTDPTDASDSLMITASATTPGGAQNTVTWKSTPSRCYYIEEAFDLTNPVWIDNSQGPIAPDGALTTRVFAGGNGPMRFFRVRAVRPLMP